MGAYTSAAYRHNPGQICGRLRWKRLGSSQESRRPAVHALLRSWAFPPLNPWKRMHHALVSQEAHSSRDRAGLAAAVLQAVHAGPRRARLCAMLAAPLRSSGRHILRRGRASWRAQPPIGWRDLSEGSRRCPTSCRSCRMLPQAGRNRTSIISYRVHLRACGDREAEGRRGGRDGLADAGRESPGRSVAEKPENLPWPSPNPRSP